MTRYYSSVAESTTLNGSITAGQTTITVTAATGFPSVPFTLIIEPDVTGKEEIVTVTAIDGGNPYLFTVTRGEDGSTPLAHDSGVAVIHGVTAREFTDSQSHIDSTDVHVDNVNGNWALNYPATVAGGGTISAAEFNWHVGQMVITDFSIELTAGAPTGSWVWSPSITPFYYIGDAFIGMGSLIAHDDSTGNNYTVTAMLDRSTGDVHFFDNATNTEISPTVPFTWATGDTLKGVVTYRPDYL